MIWYKRFGYLVLAIPVLAKWIGYIDLKVFLISEALLFGTLLLGPALANSLGRRQTELQEELAKLGTNLDEVLRALRALKTFVSPGHQVPLSEVPIRIEGLGQLIRWIGQDCQEQAKQELDELAKEERRGTLYHSLRLSIRQRMLQEALGLHVAEDAFFLELCWATLLTRKPTKDEERMVRAAFRECPAEIRRILDERYARDGSNVERSDEQTAVKLGIDPQQVEEARKLLVEKVQELQQEGS